MERSKNDWMIKELEINNFKSIKHLNIKPARVNVFIGKPNAGKSNLLEALAFLGMGIYPNGALLDKTRIRYKDIISLYYDMNYNANIILSDSKNIYSLISDAANFKFIRQDITNYNPFGQGKLSKSEYIEIGVLNNEGSFTKLNETKLPTTFKYHFKEIPLIEGKTPNGNLNPDGNNLWPIVKHNSVLKEFANNFFEDYGLKILFDTNSNKFDIMRIMGDSYYKIDFSMTPDTFQRMLYYLAAIESNKNSVILFEEPESQSYPPYSQMLAERIVDDTDNQYFITTHSPFIVEKMLERAGNDEDIKFFVTYFEDYQTKVHELSKKEIDHIIDNNVDLFFNIEAFQK